MSILDLEGEQEGGLLLVTETGRTSRSKFLKATQAN